jgi:hypothetical protein
MVLLLCFALSYAAMGAARQVGNDAARGMRTVASSVTRGSTARMWRRAQRNPVWLPLAAGLTTYVCARGVVRGTRYGARSVRTGWADGWAQGKERHSAYVSRRTRGADRTDPRTGPAPTEPPPPPPTATGDVRTPYEPRPRPDGSPPNGHGPAYATPHRSTTARYAAGYPAGATSRSSNGGTRMTTTLSGEAVNIAATRQTLQEISTVAGEAVTTIDQLSAGLSSADMDPQTLDEVMEILESATTMQTAAERAVRGLDTRHAQMEEAVNSTPHAAATDFYRH